DGRRRAHVRIHPRAQGSESRHRARALHLYAGPARRHPLRSRARAGLRLSRDARGMGVARMATALDAPRRRDSVDRAGGPASRAQLRARGQRLLPDGHRSPADTLAPRGAEGAQRVAVLAAVLQRAVRAACAAPSDALPAAGDNGLLMPALLDPHVAYELWAETYEASAHNPLMQAEEAVVRRLLAQV